MENNLEKSIRDAAMLKDGGVELYGRIVENMVAERARYGFKDRVELLDLIGGFYHRIGRLVGRYRPRERGFGPYLATSLRYFKRARDIEERDKSFRESECMIRALPTERGDDANATASEASSGRDPGDGADSGSEAPPRGRDFLASISPDATRSASVESTGKRILFLALKCAFSLTEEHIDRLGTITGTGSAHLKSRIEALRVLASERIKRREIQIRVRDKVFSGLCYYEGRAKAENDPERRREWEVLAERYRMRFSRARERVRAVQADPTNEEIALVLGLPKGTVDSGLHYLKKRGAALRSGGEAFYARAHGNPPRFLERP